MDFTSKKRYELEQICRENKIKKFTGLKKAELIELINLNIDKINQEKTSTNENMDENIEEILETSDEMIKETILIDDEQFYINKNDSNTNEIILYKINCEDDDIRYEDVGKLIKINNEKCYYLTNNINYICLITHNFELKFIGIQKETIKLELSIDYDIGKKFLDEYYKLKILCNSKNEDLTFKPSRDKKMHDIFNITNANKNKNKILYHGTSKDNLLSIINRGFGLTKKPTHGRRYGPGIYFTDDFDFAKRYAELNGNERYIIVCNVYINNICLANPRNDIFPKINNSEEYYDTGVDKLEMPKQWIKQDTKHIDIIGAFKITCEQTSNVQRYPNRLKRNYPVNLARTKFGIKIKNCYNQPIHIYYKPKTFNLYTGHISECKSMNHNLEIPFNNEIPISTYVDDEFICGIFINNEFQIIQLIKVEIGKKHYEVKI